MFARSRALRNVVNSTRSYATSVADSAGVKVAGVDLGQPTTSISVVVKAGSRYETLPGVAHALKNFAFKVSCEFARGEVGVGKSCVWSWLEVGVIYWKIWEDWCNRIVEGS